MKQIVTDNYSGYMKEGQDLVAAGFAGLAGTLLIADRKRQELSNHFAAEYLERLTILDKYNVTLEEKQHALRKWEFFGAVECEIAGNRSSALFACSRVFDLCSKTKGSRFILSAKTVDAGKYFLFPWFG